METEKNINETVNDTVLVIEGLSKEYTSLFCKLLNLIKSKKVAAYVKRKSRLALNNFNLSLCVGEIYGLVGQNGAGKSTCLKVISGISAPTSGKITIVGNDLSKNRIAALACVGSLIETPQLYSNLSGYQNLKYLASLNGVTNKDLLQNILSVVGLKDRASDKVVTYSLGMKQRLGIAQAIVHHPKLLILDEPTNGLDPQGIAEIRMFLKTLAHESNVAIIISSHILPEMQLLCDRIGILDEGNLVKEFKTDELDGQMSDTVIELSVDDVVLAEKILRESFPNLEFIKSGNKFHLKGEEATAPLITRQMVLNGVNVHGVGIRKKTLEEVYFGATDGKSHSTVFTDLQEKSNKVAEKEEGKDE